MVHIKKLNEMAGNAQRSVSYGELAELESMFNDQVEKRHIVFGDTEESTEALFDFIQQYIEGNDNPQVNVGYRESRRASARGRAINEWGSFGDDNWVDFFGEISGLSELYKFDKLCPDAELTDDDVKDSLQIFGIDTPLTNISKAYYDAIFKAFVREMQEEYGLSDDEVEKIEMSFDPVEFRFGNDYFTTKDEFEKILDKRRFRK